MELGKEAAESCFVWVDWGNRVISFHAAEGFEMLEYLTREDMLEFAVNKSREGFAIQ